MILEQQYSVFHHLYIQLMQYEQNDLERWKGVRPTVRGVAMNPVDHPMGGGETL